MRSEFKLSNWKRWRKKSAGVDEDWIMGLSSDHFWREMMDEIRSWKSRSVMEGRAAAASVWLSRRRRDIEVSKGKGDGGVEAVAAVGGDSEG